MPRLSLLTEDEQREFDYPPVLSVEVRAVCFAIDDALDKKMQLLRTPTNQVGFLLQYAYFKACKRFFVINRFRQEDVEYAAKLIGVSLKKVKLQQYKERIPRYHQKRILALLNYKSYNDQKQWVEKEITRRVERVLEPRALFFEVLHQLHNRDVEIPSYNTLAELITDYYVAHENILLNRIEAGLSKEQKKSLQALLVVSKNNTAGTLSCYKTINQSTQPKAIQASVNLFSQIQDLVIPLLPLIETLSLTPQCCEYYATWVKKAKLSQLKQFSDERKLYLRLIAFLQHQCYARQDIFVDIFLKAVQSTKNSALHQLKNADQLSRSERRSAVRHLTKTHRNYRVLIDDITEITHSIILTDKGKIKQISELLEEHAKENDEKEKQKLVRFEASLDDMAKDNDYFNILEKLSRKLQNRISDILKVLVFNEDNSDKTLFKAICYFTDHSNQITTNAPSDFLDDKTKEILTDEKGVFRISLYKILLFIHVADAIKSGNLNLKHSYRYLAIQDYLIDKDTWEKQRGEFLKLSGLEAFSDCNAIMRDLKNKLDKKYHTVNQRVLKKLNPYLSINEDKDDRVHVTTPALDEKETKHISALLGQVGYVPVLRVLSEIDQITKFTESFTHHSIKHSKPKPNSAVFFAAIIGLGCNIGIPKMAQISSGVNQNTIVNVANWYFTLRTLNAANKRIREFINQLSLPNIFANVKDQRHGSSDGRKVGVSAECLLATYSFKYFGKDKGISIYTFIDDRQVLFHHNLMSSSEREAAYVIDGLNNQSVEKIDIHSTDTHGYTELIFATTHCLDVAFAPRIKNIGKQTIYAFSTKKAYKKHGYNVLPSRPINQTLIAKHWEDILRFMATIKLNKVSASQLFKRLSSYAKDNPLYKAIKEFGRIIKSQFILTYFDDVKLRQRIEKQLSRIENSNRFANAIFYANNSEFKQADPEEQDIAVACKVLIQNSIVLWNYLYLSEILTNCDDDIERMEMISLIKEGSVLTWHHVNLHGEFDFKRIASNDQAFNLAKILALKLG